MKNVKNPFKYYEDKLTHLKTVKCSLETIVRDPSYVSVINIAVSKLHKISSHIYNFLKLYCLYCYENDINIPIFDVDFIESITKVICSKRKGGRSLGKKLQPNVDLLKPFYLQYYKNICKDDLVLTNLSVALKYEAITIVTGFKNHIINNLERFINRFINVFFRKKSIETHIKNGNKEVKDSKIKLFRDLLKNIKEHLLMGGEFDKFNASQKSTLLTIRNTYFNMFKSQEGIQTKIKEEPLQYLNLLISLNRYIDSRKCKTFSVFPLKKSIIPSYYSFDTTMMINTLFNNTYMKLGGEKKKRRFFSTGNIKPNRDRLWTKFFKTEMRVFKKKEYIFNHQIKTDGVGCSLLFIKKTIYKPNKLNKVKIPPKPKKYNEFRYLETLNSEEKQRYINHLIVGLDPGKNNLFYATDGNTKLVNKNGKTKYCTTTMGYSQNQRRKEMKTQAYKKRRKKEKKEKINNKTIQEWETELSFYNFKKCSFNYAYECIKKKNELSHILSSHYEKNIYRKLKWYSFINKQRSEAKMINNFKEKFGDQKNTLVVFGDWNETKSRKFHEPTKGKGMRRIFRKAGYDVFIINEHKTSKYSFIDGTEMEKFRKRGDPRYKIKKRKNDRRIDKSNPIKEIKNTVILRHGLLRSKNVNNDKSVKSVLMNRDFNGSMNIQLKATCLIHERTIPLWLK